MDTWLIAVITAAASILASSGFWAFMSKKSSKDDAETKLLLGLAHSRIMALGTEYIHRGWITPDELENLVDYLYTPYAESGGNGSAKQVVERVKKLEIKT